MTDFEFINTLNKESDGAWCSVLKVADIKILLDCGCDEAVTGLDQFDKVAEAAKDVDYIFLSHASHTMIGCLPYLQKLGLLQNKKVYGTTPLAKLGAQALFEFLIQKKESGPFDAYSLPDVVQACQQIDLLSFDERKRLKINETEQLIVSAIPSGNSIGGSCLKVEYNKLQIFYAIDLNDKIQQLTPPMFPEKFFSSSILITNGYMNYNSEGKQFQSVVEDRLKTKLERVLIDQQGQVMIPCSSKSKILELL